MSYPFKTKSLIFVCKNAVTKTNGGSLNPLTQSFTFKNQIDRIFYTTRAQTECLSNTKTPEEKDGSKSNMFKAPIDVDDKRSSPFNLPLDVKRRLAELKKLRHFIPGDIKPPTHIEAKSLRQKINQALDNMVDKAKNAQRRKVLARQIITPYYQDFHDIRNTDGKLFHALEQAIPEKSALYMPNFSATPLSSHLNRHTNPYNGKVEIMDQLQGKLSLVAFFPSQFAENQLGAFISHFRGLVEDNPKLQLIEINVAEKFVNSLLVRFFTSRIRAQLPESQQANYFLKFGSIESLRERLAMVNGMIGYVFLVDSKLRVRWFANGKATDTELATLTALTKKLN